MQNRNPAYMTTPGEQDVQIMASCNAGRITREEARQRLSRKY